MVSRSDTKTRIFDSNYLEGSVDNETVQTALYIVPPNLIEQRAEQFAIPGD